MPGKRDFGVVDRAGGDGCSGDVAGLHPDARDDGHLLRGVAGLLVLRRTLASYFVRRVDSERVSYAV